MLQDHKKPDNREDKVDIHVAGHAVRLIFPLEYNPAASQRVRNCLIDDYIRRVRPEFAEDAENQ